MRKIDDGALSEELYNVIELIESRLLNKISNEQYQQKKSEIYKQKGKAYLLMLKNTLLKIDSSEKRLKEFNKYYINQFKPVYVSEKEFEHLKKELGL